MQTVITKLKTQNQELAAESERALTKLLTEKQQLT